MTLDSEITLLLKSIWSWRGCLLRGREKSRIMELLSLLSAAPDEVKRLTERCSSAESKMAELMRHLAVAQERDRMNQRHIEELEFSISEMERKHEEFRKKAMDTNETFRLSARLEFSNQQVESLKAELAKLQAGSRVLTEFIHRRHRLGEPVDENTLRGVLSKERR